MPNITVFVSPEVYRQARVWAAQRDTSVSAVVQYLLQTLPNITRAGNAFHARQPRPAVLPPPSPENGNSPL
jgi:hypothetical protein